MILTGYLISLRNRINRKQLPKWVDDLNYGLLYPAFFGNMVYDIIQLFGKWKSQHWEIGNSFVPLDLLIGCIIVTFLLVDFIHLYGHMNVIVKKEQRSNCYWVCDIITPFAFFIGFVAEIHNHHLLGMMCIGIIPFVIFFYKIGNPKNDQSERLMHYFAIPALIVGVTYSVVRIIMANSSAAMDRNWYLINGRFAMVYLSIILIVYTTYALFWYTKTGRQLDKDFIESNANNSTFKF